MDEDAVAYVKAASQHLVRETEQNYENVIIRTPFLDSKSGFPE